MYDYDENLTRDRTHYGRRTGSHSHRDGRQSAFGWQTDPYRDSDRRGRSRSTSADRGQFGSVRDEDLIASDRVEDTKIYDRNGEGIGSIHNLMIDKRSGRVAFAVMKCSNGFLGMDERYYPLEWNELDYDERVGGYRVNFTESELSGRRSFDSRGRPCGQHGDDQRRYG